jgi:5-methylcytosine-specific restriction endonuclease McrA
MCRTAVCNKCGEGFTPRCPTGPAPKTCYSCRSRVCLHCGSTFDRKLKKDKRKDRGDYCNRKCAGAARRAGKRSGRWKEAQELRACRAKVKPSQRMYAAMQEVMRKHLQSIANLYQALHDYRPCLNCGGPPKDHAREQTMFCSILCAAEYPHEVQCGSCGKPFVKNGMQGRRNPLCHTCKRKQINKQKRSYGKGIRERAIRFGVERVPYRRDDVFDRDGWHCQLCQCDLLRKWTYNKTTLAPHPKNATIDHIVPMSKGGADAEWNVQACCFECNGRKSATKKGQLRFRL